MSAVNLAGMGVGFVVPASAMSGGSGFVSFDGEAYTGFSEVNANVLQGIVGGNLAVQQSGVLARNLGEVPWNVEGTAQRIVNDVPQDLVIGAMVAASGSDNQSGGVLYAGADGLGVQTNSRSGVGYQLAGAGRSGTHGGPSRSFHRNSSAFFGAVETIHLAIRHFTEGKTSRVYCAGMCGRHEEIIGDYKFGFGMEDGYDYLDVRKGDISILFDFDVQGAVVFEVGKNNKGTDVAILPRDAGQLGKSFNYSHFESVLPYFLKFARMIERELGFNKHAYIAARRREQEKLNPAPLTPATALREIKDF